jgi:hypothetical protein
LASELLWTQKLEEKSFDSAGDRSRYPFNTKIEYYTKKFGFKSDCQGSTKTSLSRAEILPFRLGESLECCIDFSQY